MKDIPILSIEKHYVRIKRRSWSIGVGSILSYGYKISKTTFSEGEVGMGRREGRGGKGRREGKEGRVVGSGVYALKNYSTSQT